MSLLMNQLLKKKNNIMKLFMLKKRMKVSFMMILL